MARQIATGHKRVDAYLANPDEIIVKEEFRGRHKPPTDDAIITMALSMLTHGQQQPVVCRLNGDKEMLLIMGFTRTAAARLIRFGFDDPVTGDHYQDAEFMLKVNLSNDMNDQGAFERNIVENEHRNMTSFIDDAYNHARLRDRYGYTNEDIIKLYNYKDINKPARLQRLLALPNKAQDLVHMDLLPVQAALDLLDITDDAEREKAFNEIYAQAEAGDKIKAADVRRTVRAHILNDDEKTEGGEGEGDGSGDGGSGPKAPKPKAKGLGMRDVRLFYTTLSTDHPDAAVRKFAKTHLAWMSGLRKDATMEKAIDELLDAERDSSGESEAA